MRHFFIGVLLVSLLAAHAFAQPGQPSTSAVVLAVLVDGNPQAGGKILAVTPLDAPATTQVQSATHATLRIGARRFVFAVARVATVGSPVGSSFVRLRDGSQPLVNVAALLSAALVGGTDLAILTQGTLETGVVTAIVPLDSGRGPVRVATDGVTQATIFRGGRETVVSVEPGRAGHPMLVLDGSEGESECRLCEGAGAAP